MSQTIIYIGGFELPDKNAAAHRVLSNAKIFRAINYDVIFIGVDKQLSHKVVDIEQTKTVVQGFDAYSVPYPQNVTKWLKYLINIDPYISIIEKSKNVNMVILYNFQAVALIKMMKYCKKHNIKCCADVTEWRSAKGENILYRFIKDFDTMYRMQFIHKKLDGLIVISSYLKEYYRKCKNVILIPALVDVSERKWINTYEKSVDKLFLVYAGNPGKKDRLDILVWALCKIKRNYQLDVIGITKEQFLNNYVDFSHVLNEDIVFHGRLSHLDTLNYIKRANYSCFFREDDRVSNAGFPTKLAEAISCGTPVITNKTSDINNYVNKMNGIVIDDLSIEAITSVLESIDNIIPVNKIQFDYKTYITVVNEFFN